MSRRSIRATLLYTLVVGLLVLPFGTSAMAARKSSPKPKKVRVTKSVTDMRFKLAESEILLGETITGTVKVQSRNRKVRSPLSGATLSVYLGKVKIGEVTTDELGVAAIEHTPEAMGEYSLKVVYAGDGTHKPARRAQGFDVLGEYFADADADGYGDANDTAAASEQPEGYVEDDTDCDDADAAVNPGASEVADNLIDDDCDGEVDEIEEAVVTEEPATETV